MLHGATYRLLGCKAQASSLTGNLNLQASLPCRRNELGLCARLLGVAANGLNENPGLIAFCLLAMLVLAALWVPLVSLLGASYSNGHIIRRRAHPGLLQSMP